MMYIDNAFNFGDIVYLKTDDEQYPRIVTRIAVTPHQTTYCLSRGEKESWHFALEISSEKNVIITSST